MNIPLKPASADNAPTSFLAGHHHGFEVIGLPAFADNYLWLIRPSASQHVSIVDPGDAVPVIAYCRQHGLTLQNILLTHHHADHSGGVTDLLAWAAQSGNKVAVYGPAQENIPGVNQPLNGGERINLTAANGTPNGAALDVEVWSVPGHTRGHLAYLLAGEGATAAESAPALFCGDLLFGLGCGRLFEGSAEQMHTALNRVRSLNPATQIYCAHEYTLLNLPFALAVDGDNPALLARAEKIRQQRAAGQSTVPLTLAEECVTNPFLRADQPALAAAVMLEADAAPVEVFTHLRQMRDSFKSV